jgi:hypothetical protein
VITGVGALVLFGGLWFGVGAARRLGGRRAW